MNKARPIIGIIVIASALGGYYAYTANHKENDQGNRLTLYGNVDIREVRLAFNGSEHVDSILVDEGDRVDAGQLVARLHTERLKASADRAKADVTAAQAEAKAARLSFQRVQSMSSRGLASSAELDEAQAKSQAATAKVAASEAAFAVTEQALKDANLYAPTNGIVRERIVEVGDFVTPQTPVLTIALMDPMWIRTYLPESYLGRIKPGARAIIHTDSYPNKDYEGWVGSISPTAEFTPKNIETPELRTRLVYQARVFVCNSQFELRLGMPATVEIDLNQSVAATQSMQRHCQEAAGMANPSSANNTSSTDATSTQSATP